MLLGSIIKTIDSLKEVRDALETTVNSDIDIYSKKILESKYNEIFSLVDDLERIDIKLSDVVENTLKSAKEILNNY